MIISGQLDENTHLPHILKKLLQTLNLTFKSPILLVIHKIDIASVKTALLGLPFEYQTTY